MTFGPNTTFGPQLPFADALHGQKYRGPNESFVESQDRLAATLSDNEEHRQVLKDILRNQRFLAAGRVQSAIGSGRDVTAFNCFVSSTIEDSSESIMRVATEAFETMRQGGGIGYDFSKIRPKGDRIVSQDSIASGPVSFMEIFNAVCGTVASAGHRRGAQMGVLRVDHPDIEEFLRAKQDQTSLTNFNVSIGVTDEFMDCVVDGKPFELKFNDKVYKRIDAGALWDEIMRGTYDWAEPGVLFLDRINQENNLHYMEDISATNPCGEQPLPPNGACLLGSFNLVKYVNRRPNSPDLYFNYEAFKYDIPHVVRMMDNVIDNTNYPLPAQEAEAKAKRRMGLGITGLANAIETIGYPYGSTEFILVTKKIMQTLAETAYQTSVALAIEKGAFPAYDPLEYPMSNYFEVLSPSLIEDIAKHGTRNSHLISIAPTGTVSICADNISSGIEPPFSLTVYRIVQGPEGPTTQTLKDYAYARWGVEGRTANELSVDDHLNVLLACVPYVDSAVSKTLNVGDEVSFNDFKQIYIKAWRGGAKGCTTFRAAGKRFGILTESSDDSTQRRDTGAHGPDGDTKDSEGTACFYDPQTGKKECE